MLPEAGFLSVFDLRQGVFDILDADGLGDIVRRPCLAAAAAIVDKGIRRHGKHRDVVDCAALDAYARSRSDRCPFMETKTFCSNCKVHCYKPDMREKIREVMRFSGPRMLFYHPIMAIRHVMESRNEKRKLEKLN